ncbi:peroxiredoxin family protein [Thiohalomonas denitrificans]|uniref:peroxiredoxin family protein n=1 Tax=Thiohalomonas denitrificans TaxID=415747 RepID=UPI0026F36AB7|nr:TlpA disulfide reductase family protein [Thiohalomonas denitrificans]
MLHRLAVAALILALPMLASAAPRSQGLTPVEERPPAPDFNLEDMEGEFHQLSEFRGQPVIINFWATWCPPCREEMPSMQRAWERLREEGVAMLAINVGETPDTVFQFTANYPVEFLLLFDLDSAVTEKWPVRGLPSTFVVDPEGRIVYQAIGGREWDDPELLQPVLDLRSE